MRFVEIGVLASSWNIRLLMLRISLVVVVAPCGCLFLPRRGGVSIPHACRLMNDGDLVGT